MTLDKLLDKIPNTLGWWVGHTEEGIPRLLKVKYISAEPRMKRRVLLKSSSLPLQRETAT